MTEEQNRDPVKCRLYQNRDPIPPAVAYAPSDSKSCAIFIKTKHYKRFVTHTKTFLEDNNFRYTSLILLIIIEERFKDTHETTNM